MSKQNKFKNALYNKTALNVAVFVMILYFLLQITAKNLLMIGDTKTASQLFSLTFNTDGKTIVLARDGFMDEALESAGKNDTIKGNIYFSSQDFERSLQHFRIAEHTSGIYYSLIGSNEINEASEYIEKNSSLDSSLLSLTKINKAVKELPAFTKKRNNLAIASLLLKLGEIPSAAYYLKKHGTPLALAYFNILTHSQVPLMLSENTALKKKLDVLSFIATGNLEKAEILSKEINYSEGLMFHSIITGDWESFFNQLDLAENQINTFSFPDIEDLYFPQSKNKRTIDILIKDNKSLWIEPGFSNALLSSPKLNNYSFLKRFFFLSSLFFFILLLIVFIRWLVVYRKEKIRKELSVVDAVKKFPEQKRDIQESTASHSWNVSNITDVLENEYIIIKTIFEKLSVPFDDNELRDKITKVKIKNKSYKVYSIVTQYNLYVKMTKCDMKNIDDFIKKGIIVFTLKDGSLQLFIAKENDTYNLFDGKTRNQYDADTLKNIWGNQIIAIRKM